MNKEIARKIIRSFLKIKDDETISDGLNRHYYQLKKRIPHKTVTIDEFESIIDKLGVRPGDVLIIHSAWRGLYMLTFTPEEMIKLLVNKVGSKGTILMPCYGHDYLLFDVKNTKSDAGVLTEFFRLFPGTYRSVFPKFSMCGFGPKAKEILQEHSKSKYQFDENSPYYIAIKEYDAKILLMGMGKHPHKITAFHCASYSLKDKVLFYKKCYSKIQTGLVIGWDGKKESISYIDRKDGYENSKKKFRELFKKTKQSRYFKNGLNLILFKGKDAFDVAYNYCASGGQIYHSPRENERIIK